MSVPRERLHLGLVGCGRLSERAYVPAIAASERFELGSICDPNEDRRSVIAAVARSAGPGGSKPAGFEGIDAMLAGSELDAVVVASPAATHFEAAAAASGHGLPCLVEKPPAANAEEAERLAMLSPEPAIAFNRRSLLGAGLRERIPTDGELGVRARIDYRRSSWDAVSVSDEALLDLGAHLVDLALWLTGARPLEVQCRLAEPDRAALWLSTTRGTCELRCSTRSLHRESVEVVSAGRRLASRNVGGLLAALGGRFARGPHTLAASVARQLDLFAAAIDGSPNSELAGAREGATVMGVIDAARESARNGGVPVGLAGVKL